MRTFRKGEPQARAWQVPRSRCLPYSHAAIVLPFCQLRRLFSLPGQRTPKPRSAAIGVIPEMAKGHLPSGQTRAPRGSDHDLAARLRACSAELMRQRRRFPRSTPAPALRCNEASNELESGAGNCASRCLKNQRPISGPSACWRPSPCTITYMIRDYASEHPRNVYRFLGPLTRPLIPS